MADCGNIVVDAAEELLVVRVPGFVTTGAPARAPLRRYAAAAVRELSLRRAEVQLPRRVRWEAVAADFNGLDGTLTIRLEEEMVARSGAGGPFARRARRG